MYQYSVSGIRFRLCYCSQSSRCGRPRGRCPLTPATAWCFSLPPAVCLLPLRGAFFSPAVCLLPLAWCPLRQKSRHCSRSANEVLENQIQQIIVAMGMTVVSSAAAATSRASTCAAETTSTERRRCSPSTAYRASLVCLLLCKLKYYKLHSLNSARRRKVQGRQSGLGDCGDRRGRAAVKGGARAR